MGQYLSWLANSVLFVLCCYLLANTANEVFAALLTPSAPDARRVAAASTARSNRSWQDRKIILQRNLFNASLLEPAIAVEEPIEEELEATKLNLRLLGTAAITPAELSWAAVEDGSTRKTVIVAVDDQLQTATVKRIERRRIVLSEDGALRELALSEQEGTPVPPPPPRRAAQRPVRPNRRRAAQPAPPPVEELQRGDVDEMLRNPANLFSQARILPKYEEGEMVGLQVNAIKPGSLFEEVGLQSGDVITSLNGIVIDSPQESAEILKELAEADQFEAEVTGPDGTTRHVSVDLGQ